MRENSARIPERLNVTSPARQLLFPGLALLFAALLFLPLQSRAEQQNIKDRLDSEYRDQLVILQGFYTGPEVRFDSNGKPKGRVESGYWASDGLFQVSGVDIDKDRVVVLGKRAVSVFDTKECRFSTVLTTAPVEIRIDAGAALGDFATTRALLQKVITRAGASELEAAAPEYWRAWMGRIERVTNIDGRTECRTADRDALLQASAAGESNLGTTDSVEPRPLYVKSDGTKVYKVARGAIKPPRLLKSPDPDYTLMAKQAHFEGTSILQAVVNQRGELTDISIVRPLGIGLDDKAFEAVKLWRFSPPTLNGRPIALQINIEVNFRLY